MRENKAQSAHFEELDENQALLSPTIVNYLLNYYFVMHSTVTKHNIIRLYSIITKEQNNENLK